MVIQLPYQNEHLYSNHHFLRWYFLRYAFLLINCIMIVVASYILCMSKNKILYITGGVLIIISYGFAAPTAAAIMSVCELIHSFNHSFIHSFIKNSFTHSLKTHSLKTHSLLTIVGRM